MTNENIAQSILLSFQDQVRREAEAHVEKVVEQAIKDLRAKLGFYVAGVAIGLLEEVSFEQMGRQLIIKVQLPKSGRAGEQQKGVNND